MPCDREPFVALGGKAALSESRDDSLSHMGQFPKSHGKLCGGARGLKKPPMSQPKVPAAGPSFLLLLCLSLSLVVPSHLSLPKALQGTGTWRHLYFLPRLQHSGCLVVLAWQVRTGQKSSKTLFLVTKTPALCKTRAWLLCMMGLAGSHWSSCCTGATELLLGHCLAPWLSICPASV